MRSPASTSRALRALAVLALVSAIGASNASSQADSSRLESAKALVFDRKYTEARKEWQAILAASRGEGAAEAAYWVAYCSEKLGENQRALREYDEFLARKPAEGFQVQEARTSRVGLAARLYKAGTKEHLPVLIEALRDLDKTVRYYAALQLADLDKDVAQPSVPVLKEIVAREKDSDLVARAKARILRIAPDALTHEPPRTAPSSLAAPRDRQPSMVRVRIFKKHTAKAEVSINMPLAFAELIFDSLPDDARRELKRKGFDADGFWKKLRGLAPMEILKIETEEGETIQIWLE